MTHRSRQLATITALGLPDWRAGPADPGDLVPAALEAGYEGVQVFLPDPAAAARAAGMADASGIDPARTADEVDAVLGMWSGGQASSVTLHLGHGFETTA